MARLTTSEAFRLMREPGRRFKTLSVGASGVDLREPMLGPSYWFQRNAIVQTEDGYWRDGKDATILLFVDGKVSVLFYPKGQQLDSCTFAYDLDPYQLEKAVLVMRRAKLRRFIVPAAKWALREMPSGKRPLLEPMLRRIVRGSRTPARRSARRRTRG